jgi:hypothetical protein
MKAFAKGFATSVGQAWLSEWKAVAAAVCKVKAASSDGARGPISYSAQAEQRASIKVASRP